MNEFERQDQECIDIQKQHGPGGELPTLCGGAETAKPRSRKSTAVDATWEPAPEKSDVQRVAHAVKGVAPYVTASVCLLYWLFSGKIDMPTVMPALLVLSVAVGGIFCWRLAEK